MEILSYSKRSNIHLNVKNLFVPELKIFHKNQQSIASLRGLTCEFFECPRFPRFLCHIVLFLQRFSDAWVGFLTQFSVRAYFSEPDIRARMIRKVFINKVTFHFRSGDLIEYCD